MAPDLVHTVGHGLGGRMFVALWGGLAVVDIARPSVGAVSTGALVVALVAGCGVGQRPIAAVAIAGTGWLVINGFVQHRYGVLGFGATSWWLLAVVLVAVLTVSWRTAGVGRER